MFVSQVNNCHTRKKPRSWTKLFENYLYYMCILDLSMCNIFFIYRLWDARKVHFNICVGKLYLATLYVFHQLLKVFEWRGDLVLSIKKTNCLITFRTYNGYRWTNILRDVHGFYIALKITHDISNLHSPFASSITDRVKGLPIGYNCLNVCFIYPAFVRLTVVYWI